MRALWVMVAALAAVALVSVKVEAACWIASLSDANCPAQLPNRQQCQRAGGNCLAKTQCTAAGGVTRPGLCPQHAASVACCLLPTPPPTPAPPADSTRVQTILSTAETQFNDNIREPPYPGGAARIDTYIRGPQGLGWTWERPYQRASGQFEWCGAFASFCYGAAGLKASIRKEKIASTVRLYNWAKGNARFIPAASIQPGDIVVMGPAGGSVYGAHIAIAATAPGADKRMTTYEGNAFGPGVGGVRIEGVIHPTRGIVGATRSRPSEMLIMYGVRPLPEDFQ